MMYLLDLFKRNGISFLENKLPGTHIVLGYFDALKVQKPSLFTHAFSHVDSERLYDNIYGQAYFTKYTMTLFKIDVEDNSKNEENIIEELYTANTGTNCLYLISSFKIDTMKNITNDIDGITFLKQIKLKIKENLDNYIVSKDTTFKYQILANLGTFDITIFIKDSSLNSLIKIPYFLRKVFGKENSPLVYSSSFFAFNYNLNIEDINDEMCEASIRISTYDIPSKSLIEGIKSALDDLTPKPQIRMLLGDSDFEIYVNVPLKRFISWYLNRGTTTSDYMASLFCALNDIYKTNFRSVETIISNSNIGDVYTADEYIVGKVCEDKQREVTINGTLNSLKLLYNNIVNYVPEYIKHTLDNCMIICMNLLQNDLRYLTGIKVSRTLKYTLQKIDILIKNNCMNVSDSFFESTTQCIRDIFMTMPSVIQMDIYSLDSIDTVDSISPISKLFYTYENFINKLLIHIDDSIGEERLNNDIHAFLTVGNTSNFKSIHYFLSYHNKSLDNRRIISFNLPNASSLAISSLLPFFLHEIGHYIKVFKTRSERNMALYDTLLLYSSLYVYKTIESGIESNILHFNPAPTLSSIIKILKPLRIDPGFDEATYNIEESMNYWTYKLRTLSESLQSSIDELERTISGILEIISKNNFFKVFSDVLYESHADGIMILMGNYNMNDYMKIMSDFFSKNKLSAVNDISYKWRLTAIIGYFYMNETKKNINVDDFNCWFENVILNLDKKSAIYLQQYKRCVKEQVMITSNISNYIYNISKILTKPFQLGNYTSHDYLNNSVSLCNELNFILNNWYESLIEINK